MGYFMAKTVRFEEILPIQKMVDRLKLEELEDPSLRGGAFGTAYRVMPQDDFPIPGPGIMKVLELDPQPRQPQRGAAWLPDSWVKFREEYQRLFDMDGLTNEKGEVCAPRSYAWGYCSEATGSGKETWRAAIVMQEILPDEAEQLSKVLKTRKKFSPEAVAQFGKLATDIIARQSQATIPIAHRDLSPNNVFVKCGPASSWNDSVTSIDRVIFIDYGQGTTEEEEVSGLHTGSPRPPRMGTISYTAPEMIKKTVIPRDCDALLKKTLEGHRDIYEMRNDCTVDVWSVGALMYQLRTGSVPGSVYCDGHHYYLRAKGERIPNEDDALNEALKDKREPLNLEALRDSRGNLSEQDQLLSEIIELCTAWDPRDRDKHFDDIRRKLAELLSDDSFQWMPVIPDPTPAPLPKIDLTRLIELIRQFEELDSSKYTSETWEKAECAYANAQTALDATSQEEVDHARLELEGALDRLEEKPDTTELNRLLERASRFSATDYTTSSWAQLDTAIRNARTALSATRQTVIDQMSWALMEAINSLVKRPNTRALEEAIKTSRALDKNSYTKKSWKELEEALSKGIAAYETAILGTDGSTYEELQVGVDRTAHELTGAVTSLVKIPNNQTLRDLLKEAEALAKSDYTEVSWSRLVQALVDAELALTSENQDTINKALAKLKKAVSKLRKKPYKDSLIKIIKMAETYNEGDCDPDTWKAFSAKLSTARNALKYDNQRIVDRAYTQMMLAVDNISDKKRKSELNKTIIEARELCARTRKYTPSSIRALKRVLGEAEETYSKASTQLQVNKEVSALQNAIQSLCPISVRFRQIGFDCLELLLLLSPFIVAANPAILDACASLINSLSTSILDIDIDITRFLIGMFIYGVCLLLIFIYYILYVVALYDILPPDAIVPVMIHTVFNIYFVIFFLYVTCSTDYGYAFVGNDVTAGPLIISIFVSLFCLALLLGLIKEKKKRPPVDFVISGFLFLAIALGLSIFRFLQYGSLF